MSLSDSTSGEKPAPAPVDPLAGLLTDPTPTVETGPEPAPALDPLRPSPASRNLVAVMLATVEGALIRAKGERWRIPPDQRPEIIRSNAHALDVYAPDLNAPWIPAAVSLGLWLLTAINSPNNGTDTEEPEGSRTLGQPAAEHGSQVGAA